MTKLIDNQIKGKKVAFLNLGCKVNAYETEAMRQMFEEAGAIITDFSKKSDIYIVNTCTVTNIADKKSRQMLHKAKKSNENAVVVAVGCYVQSSKEELEKDLSVDLLIGNNNKKQIVEIVSDFINSSENTASYVADINEQTEYEKLEIETVLEKTRAYIKIQDGCNQFCSYCIIPYARGRIRSREQKDIIEEVIRLAKKGYKEIILTGIHLSSYGLENITEIGAYIENPLILLLERLDRIEGLERIRLSSLEPRIITKDFVIRLSKLEKICPHFHLSLQSGCTDTLKRMNRRYTVNEYKKGCEMLREYFNNPAITTDVIVGFPGETEEEFRDTKEFLKDISFAQMHVFKYSKRKGTAAEKMQDQVSDTIKGIRSEELINLADGLQHKFEAEHYGDEVSVLFEESVTIEGEIYMMGHSKKYLKILLKTKEDLSNSIKNVKIIRHYKKELLLSEILD